MPWSEASMSHLGQALLIDQRCAHTMPYQVSFCKQMAVKVQAWACLSHRQVLFFSPFGLCMFGRLTSVVILRNPRMKKKPYLKYLRFLKSNGMAYFNFS